MNIEEKNKKAKELFFKNNLDTDNLLHWLNKDETIEILKMVLKKNNIKIEIDDFFDFATYGETLEIVEDFIEWENR